MDQAGTRLLSSDNSVTDVWDVETGSIIAKMDIAGSSILSPDGKTVFVLPSSSRGSAQLWNVATKSNITPADPPMPFS
jgi:WD40 repeat protein